MEKPDTTMKEADSTRFLSPTPGTDFRFSDHRTPGGDRIPTNEDDLRLYLLRLLQPSPETPDSPTRMNSTDLSYVNLSAGPTFAAITTALEPTRGAGTRPPAAPAHIPKTTSRASLVTPAEADTLISLLPDYRITSRAEGKSTQYITEVCTAVTRLARFLTALGHSTTMTDISVNDIREYLIHLQETEAYATHPSIPTRDRRLSRTTVNSYFRALSSFWSWLIREEIVTDNLIRRVRFPRPDHKVISVLEIEQVEALLAAPNRQSYERHRDYLMILTLIDTGLRVSGLINLKTGDIDFQYQEFIVMGKNHKERRVPFGPEVYRELRKFLRRPRPRPVSAKLDRVFLTRNGTPMTPDRVRVRIRQHADRAGLGDIRCTPHVFRHTFATGFARNGGRADELQRILGHNSADMSNRYTHLAPEDIRLAHRRYSPLNSLKLRRPNHEMVQEEDEKRSHPETVR